jgi:hypothetical protein
MVKYKKIVVALCNWLDQILSTLPHRCFPILAMDLNDGFGLGQTEAGWENIEPDAVIGPRAKQKEHFAAQSIRKVLFVHHLAAVDSFFEAGAQHSWHHPCGWPSKINWICIPQDALKLVMKFAMLHRLGKKMQEVAPHKLFDHVREYMELEVAYCTDKPTAGPLWDRDMLMDALKSNW